MRRNVKADYPHPRFDSKTFKTQDQRPSPFGDNLGGYTWFLSISNLNYNVGICRRFRGENTPIEECKSKLLVRLITACVPGAEIIMQTLDYIFFTVGFPNYLVSWEICYSSSWEISPRLSTNSIGLNMPLF